MDGLANAMRPVQIQQRLNMESTMSYASMMENILERANEAIRFVDTTESVESCTKCASHGAEMRQLCNQLRAYYVSLRNVAELLTEPGVDTLLEVNVLRAEVARLRRANLEQQQTSAALVRQLKLQMAGMKTKLKNQSRDYDHMLHEARRRR
jgi:hypothetical protein